MRNLRADYHLRSFKASIALFNTSDQTNLMKQKGLNTTPDFFFFWGEGATGIFDYHFLAILELTETGTV